MNKAPLLSVLKLFALLFTNRWIHQWEQPHRPPPPPPSPRLPWKLRKKSNRARPKKNRPKAPRRGRGFYQRIFTLRVALWYLIFQRLNFDQSLAAVMRDLRRGGADRLGPRRRKLSQRIKSSQTSAYNQARQRMPLELLQAAFAYLGQQILLLAGLAAPSSKEKPAPAKRQRQLLDGSTLRMLTTPKLKKAFRPARGQTDWCLMRIVVGFCARTGAILSTAQEAIRTSEQKMAWAILEKAVPWVIWIADRNFGVWSVVAQAAHHRHHRQDVVVRLTRARAGRLVGGEKLPSGTDRAIQWSPTRHDQGAESTPRNPVAGRLIYVQIERAGRPVDLWLFTTLEASDYPLELLVQWYGQRWQAELHFRSVKTQMRLAQLDVCSPEMAVKEFYAAILGYNFVRAVMWAAGEHLESGVQTLSFANARRAVLDWILDWTSGVGHATGTDQRWAQSLLEEIRQQKLPKRKKPRPSEVRMVRRCASKWPVLKGSRKAARKRHEKRTKSV